MATQNDPSGRYGRKVSGKLEGRNGAPSGMAATKATQNPKPPARSAKNLSKPRRR